MGGACKFSILLGEPLAIIFKRDDGFDILLSEQERIFKEFSSYLICYCKIDLALAFACFEKINDGTISIPFACLDYRPDYLFAAANAFTLDGYTILVVFIEPKKIVEVPETPRTKRLDAVAATKRYIGREFRLQALRIKRKYTRSMPKNNGPIKGHKQRKA
jgi:hypothetical protein